MLLDDEFAGWEVKAKRRSGTMRDLALAIFRFEQLAAEVGAPVKVSFGLVPISRTELVKKQARRRKARK